MAQLMGSKKIIGKKNPGQEPTVLKDPTTGKELTRPEDIKNASLKYCVNLLTNRKPKEEYRDVIENLEKIHQERMKEEVEEDIEELPLDIFIKTLNYLKSKPGNKYDFIIKAGGSLLSSIFNLFQIIWRCETMPDAWSESVLTQIYKGHGDFQDCDSQPFIHEKKCVLNFFSKL